MTWGAKITYTLAVLLGLMLGYALGYYRQSERFRFLTSLFPSTCFCYSLR